MASRRSAGDSAGPPTHSESHAASHAASQSTPVRSLADDLRTRSDAELAALLLARPDLARPVPAGFAALAARATTRPSIQRAVEALDREELTIALSAVVAAESHPQGSGLVTEAAVRTLADGPAAAAGLTRLWERGLLWRSPQGWHVVSTLVDVLGPHPAGLGVPSREINPRYAACSPPLGPDLDAVVADAPPAARAVLDTLTWGPPTGSIPASGPTHDAARWLIAQGVCAPSGVGHVTLVREVALQLRGGRLFREPLQPPAMSWEPTLDPATVDRVGGAHARDLLTLIDELADRWGTNPPRVLRTGGVGVRDLAALAAGLDVSADEVNFLVELSRTAGLLGRDGSPDGIRPEAWVPTADYDTWAARDAASRWAVLARAWSVSPRATHLIGAALGRGTTVGVLSPDVSWPPVRAFRQDVLDVLGAPPPGAVATPEELAAVLAWRRPLRDRHTTQQVLAVTLREAQWLGVTALGALTSAGRLLAGGASETDLASAATSAMPDPVDHLLLQADLTAIAPGPLDGALARFVRLVSDVESRGGATVLRLSTESVRRALDSGMTADEVLDRLREASRTPVPQPLDYLVRDVARRHGQTRVGGATAYLRSDDESLLSGMLADRTLAPALLRRIAPTVLVSLAEPATLLDLLREGGYAPAQEAFDGSIVVSEPASRRAPAGRVRPDGEAPAPVLDATLAQAVVERLRSESRPGHASRAPARLQSESAAIQAILRQAVSTGGAVWVGYTDSDGRSSKHLVSPWRFDGGRLYAVNGDTETVFLLHRITGVAPA